MVGHFLHPNRRNRGDSGNNDLLSANSVMATAATASMPAEASSATYHHQQSQHQQMMYHSNGGGTLPQQQQQQHQHNHGQYMHSSPNARTAASPNATATAPGTYDNNHNAASSSAPAAHFLPPQNLTAEAVAVLPPPGLSGPTGIEFSPKDAHNESSNHLVFVSTSIKPSGSSAASRRLARSVDPTLAAAAAASNERQLSILNLDTYQIQPLLKVPSKRRFDSGSSTSSSESNSNHHASSSSQSQPSSQQPPSHHHQQQQQQLHSAMSTSNECRDVLSLEERLRRERQRLHSSGGLTQFCWEYNSDNELRILVPIRGSLYIQEGLDSYLKVIYDKNSLDERAKTCGIQPSPPTTAIDPQLSPDGRLAAFCAMGEIFVTLCDECHPPVQVTYGADLQKAVTHGLADFVAQEEMDRYRGFWWSPDSQGILFTRVDESKVPPYRITHHECETAADSGMYEDHRYPFAGETNPKVTLSYVKVDSASLLRQQRNISDMEGNVEDEIASPHVIAKENWNHRLQFDPPREAQEYLARVDFLPDTSACAQWQNRLQNCLVLVRMDLDSGRSKTLLVERSDVWINLNHPLLYVLDRPIHPRECQNKVIQPPLPDPMPPGSLSFLFGSERCGFCHLYLYTYVPGLNGEQAMLIRQVTGGNWMVESVVGVSLTQNAVYVTGTYDSVLERHLYALPITLPDSESELSAMETDSMTSGDGDRTTHPNGVRRGLKQVMNALSGKASANGTPGNGGRTNPIVIDPTLPHASSNAKRHDSPDIYALSPYRITEEGGMHSVIMDSDCTKYADISSDLGRPTTVKIFEIPDTGTFGSFSREDEPSHTELNTPIRSRLLYTLYDAARDDKSLDLSTENLAHLAAPELLEFPSSDGTETLHAALYRPDARVHGPGPYPLVCAVYGGPHVQRVNRSWSQCADMRAQRLRSLGFCVVKCDNRGSSRRGLAFESAISRRLGRLEVLDQVAVVRQLTVRGVADPTRVGIYGWSYGGYLSAMCLCRAPDVFHVAVAGAPVTSWDGYDTHYTERYMGLPAENPNGYRESAVFDHVPNMRGKLLLVHGLIDENVHFRHTTRLINRLIAGGKDYDLLLFPDERHSPRRLRDRIYMERRISEYFMKNLSPGHGNAHAMRTMAGL